MTFNKLRKIVSTKFEISEDEINLETDFIKDLDADSLDIVDLISEVQEKFDVEFDENDFQELKTMGDIVDYINNKS